MKAAISSDEMVGNNDSSGGGGGGNTPQGRRGSKKRGSTGSNSRGKGGGGGGRGSSNDTESTGRSFPVVSDSRFSSMHSAPVSLESPLTQANKPLAHSDMGAESETAVKAVLVRTALDTSLSTVLSSY